MPPHEFLREASSRVILYLRHLRDAAACYEYCDARGYRVLGVVHDPDGSKYDGLFDAITAGEAEVIVVRSFADLPTDRVPRVEPVDVLRPKPAELEPRRRRPRGVRRPQE